MDKEKRELTGKLIRYLANSLLAISIFVFIMNLTASGLETYSNNLLWTQINSMWLVVVMLMLVETHYLPNMGKSGRPTRDTETKKISK
jgi:hypothetical protein